MSLIKLSHGSPRGRSWRNLQFGDINLIVSYSNLLQPFFMTRTKMKAKEEKKESERKLNIGASGNQLPIISTLSINRRY